jgi:hypothetical protein
MIEPGQPAFPELHIHHFFSEDSEVGNKVNVVPRWMGGLTKREYIAIEMMKKALDAFFSQPGFDLRKFDPKTAVCNALILTDALIAELSK